MKPASSAISGILAALLCATVNAAEPAPLVLEATLPLGDVRGRIDHLAVDLGRRRLFVAELGNDTLGVVDLRNGRLLQSLGGLSEPQGVGYAPATDELYVANGGDGTLRVFGGEALSPRGQVRLGEDADNVRIAGSPARIVAGYGRGGLAIVDPLTHARVANIQLAGHPEGFQVFGGGRVLVNVPDTQEIAVVDLAAGTQIASWPLATERGNFPLASGEGGSEAWVATRHPARLILFEVATGQRKVSLDSCGDADDVFVDSKRHRVHVICGTGSIDTWELRNGQYVKLDTVATVPGARTGLFVPELDRLFVAVRATATKSAAIWVFRP
jgi:hypothetical protein